MLYTLVGALSLIGWFWFSKDTFAAAWDAGVRYYDTAPWYGHGLSELRTGGSADADTHLASVGGVLLHGGVLSCGHRGHPRPRPSCARWKARSKNAEANPTGSHCGSRRRRQYRPGLHAVADA